MARDVASLPGVGFGFLLNHQDEQTRMSCSRGWPQLQAMVCACFRCGTPGVEADSQQAPGGFSGKFPGRLRVVFQESQRETIWGEEKPPI